MTYTTDETLDQISELIDRFCMVQDNFDGSDISERGMYWLVGLLDKSVLEIGDDGLAPYTGPRTALLQSIGAVEEYRDADGKRQLRNNRKYTQAEVERAWHDAGNESPWVMTDFLPKLKNGQPPHLSKEEVCGMLIFHRSATKDRETAREPAKRWTDC